MANVLWRRFARQHFALNYKKTAATMTVNTKTTPTTTPTTNTLHVPVLCETAIHYLQPRPQQVFVDMTFGGGGHARQLFHACPDIIVYALDRDPVAYAAAQRMSRDYDGRLVPLLGRFSELPHLLRQHNVATREAIDGVLFDFGCSSMQFDVAERGFSLTKNGPLDMRMDRGRYYGNNNNNNRVEQPLTAAEILANVDEMDLARIIRVYGEEKAAKKIARAIIDARNASHRLETTAQLANLIASCLAPDDHGGGGDDGRGGGGGQRSFSSSSSSTPARPPSGGSHVATKTFQALRIFVNNELNEINYGLLLANQMLKQHGRLVAIAFHSLEDTIVKRHLHGNVVEGVANALPLKYLGHDIVHDKELTTSLTNSTWQQLHKHVIVPDADEVERNNRSRSAKLRAAIKIK